MKTSILHTYQDYHVETDTLVTIEGDCHVTLETVHCDDLAELIDAAGLDYQQ